MKTLKNLMNKMSNKANGLIVSAKTALESKRGEGYIDTGVKIIIGVVIGGVILAGLYTLFDDTVIPTLTNNIKDMFNYNG